jgi:hypothetical protein
MFARRRRSDGSVGNDMATILRVRRLPQGRIRCAVCATMPNLAVVWSFNVLCCVWQSSTALPQPFLLRPF